MPVYHQLINLDEAFHQLASPPIIINDLMNSTDQEKEIIRNLIHVRYSSDLISVMPSCQCGEKKGEYAVGEWCKLCQTPVKPVIEESIEPIVWFRAPEGVATPENPKVLLNPMVYIMLKKRLKKNGDFNVLQWLCDTSYRSPVRQPAVIDELIALNVPRGYYHFVQNFDELLRLLLNLKAYRLPRRTPRDYLLDLIEEQRDCVFSQYLPLPNRSLLVVEKATTAVYIDPNHTLAINIIQSIAGIDVGIFKRSQREKENLTARTLGKMADVYEQFNIDYLSKKPGLIRKHLFGSRSHLSFRSVITSITKPHNHQHIEIPWSTAISVFRHHLVNKMLKRGYKHNEIIGYLYSKMETYDELLDQLFDELIQESPNQAIPCIMQRNPSMLSGSAQLMGISKVKKIPSDRSVGISILCVKPMNADFDGDSINFMLAVDEKLAKKWETLLPHTNAMLLDRPRKLSNYIELPAPVTATISSWANSEETHYSDEHWARFNALPEVS